MPADHRFEAMGTRARIWVDGGSGDLPARLEARIEELEAAWSRFRPESDVSRINSSAGPALVSADTIDLVRHALLASWETAGWFDPTLGADMIGAGYDKDFRRLAPIQEGFVMTVDGTTRAITRVRPWRGRCAGVEVDPRASTVRVPRGVVFDPGGIGKGLATDMVAKEALEMGATSVLIDIGGDLRLAGVAPADGWQVEVDDPCDASAPMARLRLDGGGVATSSTVRRRWVTDDGPRHHLIDPSTGSSSESDVLAATVVATEAWWAEAVATAAVIAGVEPALELIHASGSTGLVVDTDGVRHDAHDLDPFLC